MREGEYKRLVYLFGKTGLSARENYFTDYPSNSLLSLSI
jgi:hypothetical protein